MLRSFSVENYRSFSRRQDIELRPLTLFFGWNSGGKSALLRFLPLIAESIGVAGPPVWLGGDVGRQATWPSLVSKATGRGTLGFSLTWGGTSPLSSDWKIAGDLEGRWQEIESLHINNSPQDISMSKWCSLSPKHKNNEPLPPHLDTLRNNLIEIKEQTQWIGGVRTRAPRVSTYGGGAASFLRPDGSNAIDHLISAQLRSSADPILETTNSFFSGLGEQLVLDNPIDGVWRVLLQPTNGKNLRVDLCDTGEGYSQVLPVLVSLARARNGGPRLLFLEQPELHLHTRAQAELARQLVDTAKSRTNPQIMVETHSEVLLTSIQLAIAKGEIAPELVRIYWVEPRLDGTSDAIPVNFNSNGQPDNTALVGAFGEAIQLGQELISMQLAVRKP